MTRQDERGIVAMHTIFGEPDPLMNQERRAHIATYNTYDALYPDDDDDDEGKIEADVDESACMDSDDGVSKKRRPNRR